MIRKPCVAGQFYPLAPEVLHSTIDEMVDAKAKRGKAVGIMSPHAGYMYSGRVAAAAYSQIAEADTYVILGPNHTGMGSDFSIIVDGVFRMPSGDMRVDSILARQIFTHSTSLSDDFLAHQKEHSIEVQIPFIQYFSNDAEIVPIVIKHYTCDNSFLEIMKDIGAAIVAGIKNTKLNVVIVASTDLTHYESQETANKNDRAVLDAVLGLDEVELFKQVAERNISMCGYGPVAALITACKLLGAKNTTLAGYNTSGDITGDNSAVVGYGAVIVK